MKKFLCLLILITIIPLIKSRSSQKLWGNTSLKQLQQQNECFGCDLSFSDMSKNDLSGINLRQARLDFVNFAESDLSGADLSETSLKNAYLVKAWISGTDLNGCDATGANFHDADLSGSTFIN